MCPDGQYLASDKVTCVTCEAGIICPLRYEANRQYVTNTGGQFGNYYSPAGVST